MKYIVRSVLIIFCVSLVYVSYANKDILALILSNSISSFNASFTEKDNEIVGTNRPEIPVINNEADSDKVNEVALMKNTLTTIFKYLPFLNIKVENVNSIKTDLPVNDAISFELNTNAFEVYEIDKSIEGQTLLSDVNEKHVITIDEKKYLAMSLDVYVLCVKEIKDGAALLTNYQEAMSLLESMGIKLKHE